MKYQIVIEKAPGNMYIAYCPIIESLRSQGRSVNSALASLRKNLLCYLHDSDAELEIVVKDKNRDNKIDMFNSLLQKGHYNGSKQ